MVGTELPANSRDRSPERSQRRSLDSKNERRDAVDDEKRYGRYALLVVDS